MFWPLFFQIYFYRYFSNFFRLFFLTWIFHKHEKCAFAYHKWTHSYQFFLSQHDFHVWVVETVVASSIEKRGWVRNKTWKIKKIFSDRWITEFQTDTWIKVSFWFDFSVLDFCIISCSFWVEKSADLIHRCMVTKSGKLWFLPDMSHSEKSDWISV